MQPRPHDDAGGLEAVICLAKLARVMLTSNLWVEFGLVNGAIGTIEAICYRSGAPPDLPLAVMVKFDHYSGPTLQDGTVPYIMQWSRSHNTSYFRACSLIRNSRHDFYAHAYSYTLHVYLTSHKWLLSVPRVLLLLVL